MAWDCVNRNGSLPELVCCGVSHCSADGLRARLVMRCAASRASPRPGRCAAAGPGTARARRSEKRRSRPRRGIDDARDRELAGVEIEMAGRGALGVGERQLVRAADAAGARSRASGRGTDASATPRSRSRACGRRRAAGAAASAGARRRAGCLPSCRRAPRTRCRCRRRSCSRPGSPGPRSSRAGPGRARSGPPPGSCGRSRCRARRALPGVPISSSPARAPSDRRAGSWPSRDPAGRRAPGRSVRSTISRLCSLTQAASPTFISDCFASLVRSRPLPPPARRPPTSLPLAVSTTASRMMRESRRSPRPRGAAAGSGRARTAAMPSRESASASKPRFFCRKLQRLRQRLEHRIAGRRDARALGHVARQHPAVLGHVHQARSVLLAEPEAAVRGADQRLGIDAVRIEGEARLGRAVPRRLVDLRRDSAGPRAARRPWCAGRACDRCGSRRCTRSTRTRKIAGA